MYEGHGYGVSFGSMFLGQGDTQAMTTFNLSNLKVGSTADMTTLTSDQVKDLYAKGILGNTYGQQYTAPYYGDVKAGTGMVPMITYNDGALAFGLYYSSTTGRSCMAKN